MVRELYWVYWTCRQLSTLDNIVLLNLSERTQYVHINAILSEAIMLIYGVPQCSVLGPLQFCMYMLPIVAIMQSHDTQLYISFNLKNPSNAINKLDLLISQVRAWMICNKLKINDSKTAYFYVRKRGCLSNGML